MTGPFPVKPGCLEITIWLTLNKQIFVTFYQNFHSYSTTPFLYLYSTSFSFHQIPYRIRIRSSNKSWEDCSLDCTLYLFIYQSANNKLNKPDRSKCFHSPTTVKTNFYCHFFVFFHYCIVNLLCHCHVSLLKK